MIASKILSEGRSSRIYQSLVYLTRLAVQADAERQLSEDPNLFIATVIMNQGASLAAGEKALNNELMLIQTEPVSDMELEKAKNKIRSEWAFRPAIGTTKS